MSVSTRLGKKKKASSSSLHVDEEEEEEDRMFLMAEDERTQQQNEQGSILYQQEENEDDNSTLLFLSSNDDNTSSSSSSTITVTQQQHQHDMEYNLQHNLANVSSPWKETDVPFVLQIPRSGGSTVRDILGLCFGLTEATDGGVGTATTSTSTSTHISTTQQELPYLNVIHSEDGAAFVNVDLGTVEGIQRAQRLGLMEEESGLMAHLVLLSRGNAFDSIASDLFTQDQNGRLILGLLRHPIERSVSMFHYLGVATWEEKYDPTLALISIEMYARSHRAEHNWLVRTLTGKQQRQYRSSMDDNDKKDNYDDHDDIGQEELELAKRILREKALIGLLEEKGESMRRIETYLGLHQHQGDDGSTTTTISKEQKECRDRMLHWSWPNQHAHPQVEKDSTVWDLLMKKNALDMELYEYARDVLFPEQAKLFETTKNHHHHYGNILNRRKDNNSNNEEQRQNDELQEVTEAMEQSEAIQIVEAAAAADADTSAVVQQQQVEAEEELEQPVQQVGAVEEVELSTQGEQEVEADVTSELEQQPPVPVVLTEEEEVALLSTQAEQEASTQAVASVEISLNDES